MFLAGIDVDKSADECIKGSSPRERQGRSKRMKIITFKLKRRTGGGF